MFRLFLALLVFLLLFGCAEAPVQYSEFHGSFRPVNHDSRYSAQQIKDAQARKSELIGVKQQARSESNVGGS
jgi:hypothetical protein